MDYMMQTVRKNTNPLVKLQVLFIGDLLQLPPVIRDEEWRTRNLLQRNFFFIRMYTAAKVRHCILSYQYTVRLTPSLFRDNLEQQITQPMFKR
jgi:hypothetical protein